MEINQLIKDRKHNGWYFFMVFLGSVLEILYLSLQQLLNQRFFSITIIISMTSDFLSIAIQ